ncbi:hypothetical protein HYV83_05110 [Candidatus Woesearchaeota archaeon]|nr:hypothetical protein [Candidatus Woesearchaeota archaeon]
MVGSGVGDVWAKIEQTEVAELKKLMDAYNALHQLPLNAGGGERLILGRGDVNHITQAIILVTAANVLTERVKRSATSVFNTLEAAMNQINQELNAASEKFEEKGPLKMLEGVQLAREAANKLRSVIIAIHSILALEGQVRK